jgi:hypothetical protein
MENLMIEKKKKHFNTFKLKYNLLLGLNLNYTNKQLQAIETLAPISDLNHQDIEILFNIKLSLITFYFQQQNYKRAHTQFSKLYHTDQWYIKKVGIEWVIKKNLIEILLHIELKNIDLVESRIASFKRSYFKYLKKNKQDRVITYLLIIETFYKTPEKTLETKFKSHIETSFEWIGPIKEDIFVISFYAWLKSKLDNEDLYLTTLDLINKSKAMN